MIKSQEIEFKSSTYKKTSFQENKIEVCKFRRIDKALDYKLLIQA